MSNNPKLFHYVMHDADGNQLRVSQAETETSIDDSGSEQREYYPYIGDWLIRSRIDDLEINGLPAIKFSGLRYATDSFPEVNFGAVVILFGEGSEYALVIEGQDPESESDALDAAQQLAATYRPAD